MHEHQLKNIGIYRILVSSLDWCREVWSKCPTLESYHSLAYDTGQLSSFPRQQILQPQPGSPLTSSIG